MRYRFIQSRPGLYKWWNFIPVTEQGLNRYNFTQKQQKLFSDKRELIRHIRSAFIIYQSSSTFRTQLQTWVDELSWPLASTEAHSSSKTSIKSWTQYFFGGEVSQAGSDLPTGDHQFSRNIAQLLRQELAPTLEASTARINRLRSPMIQSRSSQQQIWLNVLNMKLSNLWLVVFF